MREDKWAWLVRMLAGGGAGLLAALIFVPYFMDTRLVNPVMCLLCVALGVAAGLATLPFADDGKSLLLHSGAHFAVTSALFVLLMAQFYGWWWEGLLLLEGMLAVLYALIWLGRWIGWYMEVMQLRTLLGLDAGPSPLKWRETLPYAPFVLLLCDGLPLLLRWAEHEIQRSSILELPVLSALILPFVLLPAGGFFAGVSLGKRQGVCPLYPVACFVCYLPMVYLLFNDTAMFHCFMVAVPALAGNVIGWMYRRAVPKRGDA
ncbi:DUF3021 family protein [Oscillospiraceae bacterium 44-5]